MVDKFKILSKIEKLVDQLPYETAEINIELENETLVLNKQKTCVCGFSAGDDDEKQ